MKNNYLLESEDNYLISLKIKEIVKEKGFPMDIIHNYDLEEVPLSQALEDLDTYGLFSEKKTIIISHIESYPSDNKDKDLEHLFKYFKNPLDDILVFVTATKLNNTKKITKELKKLLEIIPLEVNANQFVKNELKGFDLEQGVVSLLVQDCLEDIGRLHQECCKLKLFSTNHKITKSDVEELVIKKLGDSRELTFDFVRVLASKNKKEALNKYYELQKYSVDAIPLVGLLASQFLIMYQVKLLENERKTNQQIADLLGEKPYRIQKTRELTRYYSLKELGVILRKLSDMDLKMKSTDVDGEFLVELFILENT